MKNYFKILISNNFTVELKNLFVKSVLLSSELELNINLMQKLIYRYGLLVILMTHCWGSLFSQCTTFGSESPLITGTSPANSCFQPVPSGLGAGSRRIYSGFTGGSS
jgi:hypothetical protein